MLYALLFLLQASPAPPVQAGAAPERVPQNSTWAVDPVGDWLISEANLKHPDAAALAEQYRQYRLAGGTGTFRDWRRASVRGVDAPFPAGRNYAWNGKAYIVVPGAAPAAAGGRRECVEGRRVRVIEGKDTWFRALGPDEMEQLPSCSYLRGIR